MFTDALDAIENKTQPAENFYDGYIVNTILDAAYLSAATKKWEPVKINGWRGMPENKAQREAVSYDENYFLIKEEVLPSGEKKFIVKNKKTGSIEKR